VLADFRGRYPFITAITDPTATNIDRKMVSAVSLAQSRYVWLFGDDDLPEPGAVERVMGVLREKDWGLLVLNASSYDAAFSSVVEKRRIRVTGDRDYAPGEHESLLADTASYATFLGGLVFEKAMWDSVDPTEFLGSDYVHVAVLYRAVVGRHARLVAEPQLRLRLGGATWADRYFEVELVHWPGIIWGLPPAAYSDASKARVCARRPLASWARLLATRAYGYYGHDQYRHFVATDPQIPPWKRLVLRTPLMVPRSWAGKALVAFRHVQRLWGDPNLELSLHRLKHRG